LYSENISQTGDLKITLKENSYFKNHGGLKM